MRCCTRSVFLYRCIDKERSRWIESEMGVAREGRMWRWMEMEVDGWMDREMDGWGWRWMDG